MINASVADFEICDPTLDRCVEFSKSWRYSGIKIVNLFALISTDPEVLLEHESNNYILEAISGFSKIILKSDEKTGCRG